jgi:hypothetical protein
VATPAVAALAGLPAGVDLLTAIAGLNLSSLPGFDLPLVLRAVYRLGNHTRALLLDVVAEIMRRKDPDGVGSGDWDAVAVHEVRAALALSRTAANRLNSLAQDLHQRLPQVLEAMRDGRLDQPRARVFSSWTALLSEAHARAVVDAVLPIAPRLTTGELIDEIRRTAIELDPDFAERHYNNDRSQRRVRGAIDSDGTGHITAEGLSAEQIAAACDRLDAIGWYLKQTGHPDRLHHIRADVFAGLLTGEHAGLTDEELLEKLLATIPPTPEPSTSDTQDSTADTDPSDDPGRTDDRGTRNRTTPVVRPMRIGLVTTTSRPTVTSKAWLTNSTTPTRSETPSSPTARTAQPQTMRAAVHPTTRTAVRPTMRTVGHRMRTAGHRMTTVRVAARAAGRSRPAVGRPAVGRPVQAAARRHRPITPLWTTRDQAHHR